MTRQILTDDQLKELRDLAKKATPAPWYVRHLDDGDTMNLVAISTVPDTGKHERFPDFASEKNIAATLIQTPRYVSISDHKWRENATYIVAATNALPDLVEEIFELRKHVKK